MVKRLYLITCICILGSLIGGPSILSAWGETHVESTIENRSMVTLRVNNAELQKWVPETMQIVAAPAGPFKGANLSIIFIDISSRQDPQGKPIDGGSSRNAVFVVPAKLKQTGEMVYPVIYGLTDNAQMIPGAYKCYKQASVRRQLIYTVSGADGVKETDTWEFRNGSEMLIDFHVQYKRALPKRAKPALKVYSAAEPEFFRIYKTDYIVDLVKSNPAKIDHAEDYRLKVSVPKLKKIFDGTEQLVAVTVFPAYAREVFLP